MNKKTLHGMYRRRRGGLIAEWGRLTENDRLIIDGKIEQMLGMLEERYGVAREQAIAYLERYMGLYEGASKQLLQMRKPTAPKQAPQRRWAFMTAGGLTIMGIIGGIVFRQLLTHRDAEPPILPEDDIDSVMDPLDDFEAAELQAMFVG